MKKNNNNKKPKPNNIQKNDCLIQRKKMVFYCKLQKNTEIRAVY